MTTTAFLHLSLAAEGSIFNRQRVAHSPPHPIIHAAASNFQVVLVLANKSLQRINHAAKKDEERSVETLNFAKIVPNAKVSFVTLDPIGTHLILSLRPTDSNTQPDILYLNRKSKKFKFSSKIKGHHITAVAWNNRNVSDNATGQILLGTSKGLVFETELESGEDKMFSSSLERYWRQLLNLGEGRLMPITSVSFFNTDGSRKYFVIVTTAERLYQFQGKVNSSEDRPLLMNVISNKTKRFLELPSKWQTSHFSYAFVTKERNKPYAKHPLYPLNFGWMIQRGVHVGRIDQDFGDEVTADCKLMQHPDFSNRGDPKMDMIPLGFLMTEFHVIFVYKTFVRGICTLNEEVVFNSEFDPADGNIKGFCRDIMTGNFYVFTEYVIFKFKVTNEGRNIWKIYLERKNFDLALQYANEDHLKLNKVYKEQAEDLFLKGRYVESAMHFAKTRCSFEQISLKFMEVKEKSALINFLKRQLESVSAYEVTQSTVLVVWLIENYLSEIRMLKAVGDTKEADQIRDEFLRFLQTGKVCECVDQSKGTIYQLLGEHGDKSTLVQFATIMKDYDRVISYHLQNNAHFKVLNILEEQRQPELFHTHGPSLMTRMPKDFIDLIIRQASRLGSPVKMLPSLVVCSRKDEELEAIRYLEFAINNLKCQDSPLHNLLISLYVKHQPDKIVYYLMKRGLDVKQVPYDIEYTLRLFEEYRLKKASLILYCILRQLDEAVEIALEIDLKHAEKVLEFAESDEERRKVWLRIAKHIVTNKKDIGQAMEYLQRSGNLISIEDILPFFPDFVTIDHFKEAICEALEKYNKHIEELRLDMEEANMTADRIRAEIQTQKDGYVIVRAVDTCCVCNVYLMLKSFHVFKCGHKFHTDCLVNELKTYASPHKNKRIQDVRVEIEGLLSSRSNLDAVSVDSRLTSMPKIDQLKSELEELIANQCLYCGDLMIQSIDKPLIPDESFDATMAEWL